MKEGSRISFSFDGEKMEGLVIQSKDEVNIKLDSGYNIIVPKNDVKDVKEIKSPPEKEQKATKVKDSPNLPTITILHLGGTIASKVDYKTGAVHTHFTPEELLSLFPELKEIANIRSRFLRNMWSEDIRFSHYNVIAEEIVKEVKADVDGIIVTHGTDTMHMTSAALTFMLDGVGIPIVLVGAQRSSDRGSSDGPINVLAAAQFITKTDFGGVGICMHETENDDWCWVLQGTKCRKMHSSRRDAFQPINAGPGARVNPTTGEIQIIRKKHPKRKESNPKIFPFNPNIKVGLLKVHPNMFAEEFSMYEGFDGLLIEGTGIGGHPPINKIDDDTQEHEEIANAIKNLVDQGTVVAAATQTIYGRINMNVYSTGRKMQELGIIGNYSDMHPETAFIKLAWLLSNFSEDETKQKFTESLKGEILEASPLEDSHTTS